jgi:uncharacterized membrane protein YfhO
MYRQEKKYYQKAFFIALIMGVVLLLPFVIIDGGYFVFYGDYNAQQIPFYKVCINAVHSGNFGWNWQTDLGASLIGSYSFYTLGSPFFWFAALFPVSWSQYLMAPLLALKLAFSSLFAFIYIRRFVTKPQNALIGGILYAFSGFSLYNIFFNHFHEAIVFFPLLLIGLEEAVINKRRGMFLLTVALNAFVNYFFFVGECIFLVIYFIVRLAADKRFRVSLGGFFCLAFESVVGVTVAGILFVPSIFQVLDVPRSTSLISDWGFLFYEIPQRYGLILESMFFPPEPAARSYMFPLANAKWSSVAIYLPLFSMAGVIAFVKDARKHWARVLIVICLVMVFVPGLNAAFSLFNSNFYTRWFYMPELICCLATVYALEHEEIDISFGNKVCAVIVTIMSLLVIFVPMSITEETIVDGVTESWTHYVPRYLNKQVAYVLYLVIAISLGTILLLRILLKQRKKISSELFTKRITCATIICCMVLGYYFVGYGRILGPYIGVYNEVLSADIKIDDPDFYRMESVDEINNVNMLWGMSSITSFQSIVPASTFELYEFLGEDRSVNSQPDTDDYALRALTRVKYLIMSSDIDDDTRKEIENSYKIYEYMETQGGYDIYKTDYALPMGYAYDSYVTESQANTSGAADRLMMRAVILSNEQAEKYSDILSPLDESLVKVTTFSQFKKDAAERIDEGVVQFSVNNNGFTAMSNYSDEKLVVFSVPYDDGWTAYVGGEEVEIEQVNVGFMAIRVPAGAQEISFEYRAPGLNLGILMTIVGIVLTGGYIFFFRVIKRHKPKKYVHLYNQNQLDGVKAHKSYIKQLSKQIYECPEKADPKRSKGKDELSWPELEEAFMLGEKYDFTNQKRSERASHIAEGDEAYEVMKELDERGHDGESEDKSDFDDLFK